MIGGYAGIVTIRSIFSKDAGRNGTLSKREANARPAFTNGSGLHVFLVGAGQNTRTGTCDTNANRVEEACGKRMLLLRLLYNLPTLSQERP